MRVKLGVYIKVNGEINGRDGGRKKSKGMKGTDKVRLVV